MPQAKVSVNASSSYSFICDDFDNSSGLILLQTKMRRTWENHVPEVEVAPYNPWHLLANPL
jgi:hypothetical protein